MPIESRPIRILLVEDNPGDARLLRELLRETTLRFELQHVERLGAALEALTAAGADVVLLDLSLPDAHGMTTVTGTLGAAAEVPILVLTGLDDEELAVQAVQTGAQDYLVKGQVDAGLLGRAIRYALERKRLESERMQLLLREQQARSTAEAAVAARDEVLRVVSHDLGNSLSAVGIQALLLERTPPERLSREEVAKRTTTIRQLVAGMQRLRQDLLDVASIEAGRLALEVLPVDIGSVSAEVIELHADLAAEKSLELRLDVPAEVSPVLADRVRLIQVLSNLLGNAIKFTPPRGAVELYVADHPDGVCFTVRDTGVGIPSEDLARIFDRFWKSQQGNRQGAGLGLAIARGIVEAHQGRIWADSQLGAGSCFRFVLPTAASP